MVFECFFLFSKVMLMRRRQYCAHRPSACGCTGIPWHVSLNLLLKFYEDILFSTYSSTVTLFRASYPSAPLLSLGNFPFQAPPSITLSNQFYEDLRQLFVLEPFVKVVPYMSNRAS